MLQDPSAGEALGITAEETEVWKDCVQSLPKHFNVCQIFGLICESYLTLARATCDKLNTRFPLLGRVNENNKTTARGMFFLVDY